MSSKVEVHFMRQVLDLIAQGVNNTTIARRLYLSSKTIRNHVSNIFSKLQVADRAEAIVRARFGQQRPQASLVYSNPVSTRLGWRPSGLRW